MILLISILIFIGVVVYAAKNKETIDFDEVIKTVFVILAVIGAIGFAIFSTITFI